MKNGLYNSSKNLFNRLRKRPLLIAIIGAVVLAAAISVTIVACTSDSFKGHVTGDGLVLEDGYWMTNDDGLRFYDREGYESSVGIDISEWVEDIDFKAAKKMGIDYVILRVGYRGYVSGGFVLDNNLDKYLKDAKKAGLKLGAYFVSQAINEEEAREEARLVMDKVKGYDMEMPLYIDLEAVYDDEEVIRTDKLTADDYTRIAAAFCDEVEAAGYRGGIYANEAWFNNKLNFNKIRKYDIWLAKYTNKIDTDLSVNMWQYSCEGLVDGCDMWVDMNVRVSLAPSEEETVN